MSTKKPLIAILADLPIGRILPEQFGQFEKAPVPWLYALFGELEKQSDFEIHWITLKRYAKQYEHIEHGNQHIHIVPAPSLAIGLFTGHFIASRRLRKLLKQLNPDLVHVWGIEMPYAKACANFKTKKLLSYQGVLTACCQQVKMKIYPRLQAFWEQKTTPKYKNITCESPWAREQVLQLAPDADIKLIEYGVETSFLNKERHLTEKPKCLFVGTIYPAKGIDFLMEAFMSPKLQHIDLYLAGRGDLRAIYEPKSTLNIHWLGQLNRPELQRHLSDAWCLVHPTLADTGPTCIKEALCMGLPIVTTTHAGCKQYIEDGKNGYIIPIKDSEAIKDAVLKLTESREKAIAMGQYKLEENRNALDVQLTSKKFLALYRHLLNGEIYPCN